MPAVIFVGPSAMSPASTAAVCSSAVYDPAMLRVTPDRGRRNYSTQSSFAEGIPTNIRVPTQGLEAAQLICDRTQHHVRGNALSFRQELLTEEVGRVRINRTRSTIGVQLRAGRLHETNIGE